MDRFYSAAESKMKLFNISVAGLAKSISVQPRTLQYAFDRRQKMDFDRMCAIAGKLRFSLDSIGKLGGLSTDSDATRILNHALELASTQGSADHSAKGVSLVGFLDWWYSMNGRIDGSEQILERVDLFVPPESDSNLISPIQTGPISLASIEFNVQNASDLTKTLTGFSKKCNDSLVAAHLEAIKKGEPVLSHPALDETLPSGDRFAKAYRRVLAPMVYNDKSVVVNYSEEISGP